MDANPYDPPKTPLLDIPERKSVPGLGSDSGAIVRWIEAAVVVVIVVILLALQLPALHSNCGPRGTAPPPGPIITPE